MKIREQLYNWSDNEVKNKSVLLYTLMVKVFFLSVVGIARKWGIVNTMTFYSLQNYIVCNYRLYYLTLKTMVKTLLNIYILLIWIYIYFIEKIKYSKKNQTQNCFSWMLLASFILEQNLSVAHGFQNNHKILVITIIQACIKHYSHVCEAVALGTLHNVHVL